MWTIRWFYLILSATSPIGISTVSSRRAGLDMSTEKTADPLQEAADLLRSKKGLAYSTAKLDLGESSKYVEFFRAKDLARLLRDQQELMEPHVQLLKLGNLEQQSSNLVQKLLKRGLILRCDRKFKEPKPGRTKVPKFPKNLLVSRDQSYEERGFYAWQYDQPTSPWLYVWSVLLVVVVVGACLFPLAPYKLRLWVVFGLMGLLGAMLSIIAVRYVLYLAIWITTGWSLWLFPNMMDDKLPINEAFRPVISFNKNPGSKSQYLARLGVLVVSALTLYALYSYSPDKDTVRASVKEAHDSILSYLDNSKRGLLAGETKGPGGGPDILRDPPSQSKQRPPASAPSSKPGQDEL